MNALAFCGNQQCKQQAMEHLRGLRQGGTWVTRPLHWNGSAGSLVGSLLRGEDLDEWVSRFGLPKWLALALDELFVAAPSVEEGVDQGIAMLDAIAPGARLDAAGSQFLRGLLEDADLAAAVAGHGALAEAQRRVAALHGSRRADEPAVAAAWRTARRDTVALTDTLPTGSPLAATGACIEAAAWDPASSRTVVSDALRNWLIAKTVAATSGHWSADDEERVDRLSEHLYAQAREQASDPEAFIDLFKLLEEHHPDEAAGIKAHAHRQHEQRILAWRRAAALMLDALRSAGCALVPALIPRAHLFANPARSGMSISPDGVWLAWLATDGGAMNIWAAPRQHPGQARQITFDHHRGIQGFSWSYVPGMLLYSQDLDGDENWRLFGADAAGGGSRELTPVKPGARVSLLAVSRDRRGEIVVMLNERDPRYPDLYLLDLASGALTLLEENTGFAGFLLDDRYQVHLAMRSRDEGGSDILRRGDGGQWQPWITLEHEDTRGSGPSHFSADGRTLYFFDSRGRDTAALCAIDLASDSSTVLAHGHADIGGVITDPIDYRPLAYGLTYDRYRLHVLDESIRADIDFLNANFRGEWRMSGGTDDGGLWLVSAFSDVKPPVVWLYDRTTRTLTHLLDLRPELADARLARMRPVIIDSRDGLPLVSYLTLPVDADAGTEVPSVTAPLPLVMLVHGGPWTRDSFGYNGMHQWLANRGYAVLAVNFRGSTGFGKAFVNAADGEWGRRMDEDLEDAVQWAVDQGIADPARLAIFGGSYGGYAVLSALTRYPERYACGIDVVGPSNLETLLASIPAYWEADRVRQYRAIADPRTPEGLAVLRDRSPLHRAAAIRSPLLVAQGANDPRVKQAESEQMVAALKANDIPVTYALYADEGHGFVREANRMSFNALCESFLARHLGGREEAWTPEDFAGTSLRIVENGMPTSP